MEPSLKATPFPNAAALLHSLVIMARIAIVTVSVPIVHLDLHFCCHISCSCAGHACVRFAPGGAGVWWLSVIVKPFLFLIAMTCRKA